MRQTPRVGASSFQGYTYTQTRVENFPVALAQATLGTRSAYDKLVDPGVRIWCY